MLIKAHSASNEFLFFQLQNEKYGTHFQYVANLLNRQKTNPREIIICCNVDCYVIN